MQFKVPQDVQREDRIVGPLTLRQLIICGIGGMTAYAIYTAFVKQYEWITWLPPVVIVAILTLSFAFIRPLDLTFAKWVLLWIEFTFLPRQRQWIQASAEAYPPLIAPPAKKGQAELKAEAKAEAIMNKHKKIEELTKILNSSHV